MTAAIVPPIHLSTTFERDAEGGYPQGFVYIRDDNPGRVLLEAGLAKLEGGVAAAICEFSPTPLYPVNQFGLRCRDGL